MNTGITEGVSETSSAAAAKHSKKPKYSRFTQQELPACKSLLTPGWVITAFLSVGIIFIPIGLASLFASEHVVEIVDRYDKDCIPSTYSNDTLAYIQSTHTNKTCIKSLTVPKKMKSPIYVYYQLDKFYQNHRRLPTSHFDSGCSSERLHLLRLTSYKYLHCLKCNKPEFEWENVAANWYCIES